MILILTLLGSPAYAWNAIVGEVCTLTHETEAEEIRLTYDPAQPLYTLEIARRAEGWTQTPWFAMRFEGPNPIEIGTPRHRLSDDAMSLFVSDTGFGNVLDGLEFNQTAYAFTQDHLSEFSLEGAAPEVRKFRTCAASLLS